MNLRSSIAVTAAMLVAHPTAAQDHRLEADPVGSVRENFVACDVRSQLQRVMDDPRFLLTGECEPLSAGRRVRTTQGVGHMSVSIRKTRSRRANGHTRKCCPNNSSSNAPTVISTKLGACLPMSAAFASYFSEYVG